MPPAFAARTFAFTSASLVSAPLVTVTVSPLVSPSTFTFFPAIRFSSPPSSFPLTTKSAAAVKIPWLETTASPLRFRPPSELILAFSTFRPFTFSQPSSSVPFWPASQTFFAPLTVTLLLKSFDSAFCTRTDLSSEPMSPLFTVSRTSAAFSRPWPWLMRMLAPCCCVSTEIVSRAANEPSVRSPL